MTDHCLIFSAPVNPQSTNQLLAHLVDLQVSGATSLTIGVSSPGGAIVNGIAAYNAVSAAKFRVSTHNIGNIDSIAIVLFLEGAKRLTNSTSTFMFHGVGFDGNANERLEERNLLEKLEVIRSDHKRISSIIAQKTSLSIHEAETLFKQQSTRDAIWSVKNRFADKIDEFKMPAHRNIRHIL
jgi:ATP-dependent Clp protease, protease subunit